ncbi:Protein of unknown function [Cotesia congregata]|uniref:Uncharacterized protein n=1 Tax=Cotesia congregata TaxID=51543 RepID=A0A8J2EAQ4_COTCN|nr:Protein of unknown function [Cotesia congregata]
MLLKSGADANAEFTKELVEKYESSKDWKWSDEFRSINVNFCILRTLLRYKVNVEITGKNNKTLLMYAPKRASMKHLNLFTEEWGNKCRPKFLNARDDYGRHAVHYLLPNEKFGKFRYARTGHISHLLWELTEAGADINAIIDHDPDTLLLNKVAYRCEYETLERFLKLLYPYPAEGRPLHYCMLPVDPEKFVEDSDDERTFEIERNRCIKLILETYTL